MKSSVVGTLSLAALLIVSPVSTLGTAAPAGELSGVTLPDTLKAGEKTLKLNGLGLRQKAMFDKMLALVPDVKEGSTLTFAYLPGKGTTLSAGSKELGFFEGKGFAD